MLMTIQTTWPWLAPNLYADHEHKLPSLMKGLCDDRVFLPSDMHAAQFID
jgi:hypothetical protein